MKDLMYRPRRLRQNENMRRLISENKLSVDDLIMPFFVRRGENIKKEIISMPGQYQLSVDNLIEEVKKVKGLGIPAVLLFDVPDEKDDCARPMYSRDGLMQEALCTLKEAVEDILVIANLCLCEHTTHGHCGIIKKIKGNDGDSSFMVDNDATLEVLAKAACSYAEAGADMIAPSGMMDGQVAFIRKALDTHGHSLIPIMAYSVKYASHFYGPFRQAAESAPQFGNRATYQMDYSNSREALKEVALDVTEGADIVMIKPALASLDIIREVRNQFNVPVAAYNVSGEYAMVKAAAERGWIDEESIVLEILKVMKRAGADIIISYHAREAALKLK